MYRYKKPPVEHQLLVDVNYEPIIPTGGHCGVYNATIHCACGWYNYRNILGILDTQPSIRWYMWDVDSVYKTHIHGGEEELWYHTPKDWADTNVETWWKANYAPQYTKNLLV